MRNKSQNKTVFAGLSGGVDSSVSAYLLKEAGYNVVGVFIKIWQSEFDKTCTWKTDRRDAMRVAAHLKIPFLTLDLSSEYKNGVISYMIDEYKAGRTPNPDVLCNKEVKFKAFLQKALELGADFVATGHYARVSQNPVTNLYELHKAKDSAKEQSYFLWTLTQKELSKIIFPVGSLQKRRVRSLAKKGKIPTFARPDSQGLCFVGKVDFKDFLKNYIEEKEGDVLNEKGEVIGKHPGSVFFTLGERHGFVITAKGTDEKRLYVVAKNTDKNTITVSEEKDKKEFSKSKIALQGTNWISGLPERDRTYEAQIRYHGELLKVKIEEEGSKTFAFFDEAQITAPGQSIVVYSGEKCIGGGVME